MSAGSVGVDWRGNYGAASNFTGTMNQNTGAAVTATGDYTFDGISDAAYRIPFGTVFSPSADSRYVAPAGKTGRLYTGLQTVIHSSAIPLTAAGIYRFSASVVPNQLQRTNPTNDVVSTMSLSAAYFAKKADFLNGLDSAGALSFSNTIDGASMDVYVRNTNAAAIGFLVQDGSRWYATVAKPAVNNAYAVLSINPYTASWYAFDPSANQFLNAANPGTAVAGSTFTNIMAFGIYGQHTGVSGTAANAEKFDVQGFTGSFAVAPIVPRSGVSSGFFTGLSNVEIDQIRLDAQQRAEEFFTSQAGTPLDPRDIIVDWENRGDFTRYWNQDIVMFAMRAFELNEMLDEANAAVQEMCQYHLDRPQTLLEVHSFPTVTDVLFSMCRFYGPNGTRAPGRLSSAAYAKILETMWEWTRAKSTLAQTETEESQTWWIENSENHHAQHWSTCWGFSMILKEEPLYRERTFDDGHTPQEHYDAWTVYLREYLIQRMTKGMLVEIDSPSYATATLKGIYILYDFSDDPVLKKRAGQFLTLYWALWAEQQIDGVHGGAKTRCYPDAAQGGVDFVSRAAWYALGIGDPEFRHISMLQFVMTTWQMPDTVLDLIFAPSGRGVYEIRQRRMGLAVEGYGQTLQYRLRSDFGGILRYSYCTPDFIMSSLLTEARPRLDWADISSQNRWSGVIFRGHTNARIYPYLVRSGDDTIYNGFWSAQSKGTLIAQKLTDSSSADQWRVWFSKEGLSAPVLEGDWVFAEATNAFAAVRVVKGAFSFSAETNADRWIACSNINSPVIIEVAQKSDFVSAEAFRTAVLALPVAGSASNMLYTGLSGDQFVFHTDQSGPPEINGVPVDYAPVKVYDSPYIQGEFGAGAVSVQYGGNTIIIDSAPFADDTNTVALWHFDGIEQDADGTYFPDDTSGAARDALNARIHIQSTNSLSVIADGKFGSALRFEGQDGDQYILTGSSLWPAGQGTFRYQGWIRLKPGDSGGFLFHMYDQVSLSVSTSNVLFMINKSGVPTDTSSTNLVEISAAISTASEWQFIEAVYDGGMMRLVSETETVSAEGVGEIIPDRRNIFVGSRKNKSNFIGELDEVKISVPSAGFPDPLDYDGDRLPDCWELAHFGNRWTSGEAGDADGDGFSDLQEYRAGTLPSDPGSLLKLYNVMPGASAGEFTVHWQSVTGKYYRVLHTTNLVTGIWETRASGIPGAAPESSRTITAEDAEGFFRIQTE